MRRPPVHEDGTEIVPPPVEPCLNQQRVDSRFRELLVKLTRHYELITPLFGGGVEPGVTDPVTVIRGSAVRGHLRFWWRACRGGQYGGDLARMKVAEDQLWGAASTSRNPRPSKVQVQVEVTNRGRDEKPFKTKTHPTQDWRRRSYTAFPLQDTLGSVRSGVAFTLTITFPKSCQVDVEAALWAWETFGGIGARTRRGFGALKNLNAPVPEADPDKVRQFLRTGLMQHVVTGTWPAGVPHLSSGVHLRVTATKPTVEAAWEHLIQQLKAFRQNRNPGTVPKRPGRSKWPEADEIRRLTGRRCARHATPVSTIRKFPRAAFGLPIEFHFKDNGDPERTKLQGRGYGRLASPLILRPLVCTRDHAVGVALILEGTGLPPGGLMLKNAPDNPSVQAGLTAAEASSIPPLNGNTDVLLAFLNTL